MRDYATHLVINEVTPGCEWVINGEGTPTRKYDGTACLVRGGTIYKRYDCKTRRTASPGFEPCEPGRDPVTGHWPGWVPITKHDKWHIEAFNRLDYEPGTYELCGPRVQGNPEHFSEHVLVPHGHAMPLVGPELTFEGISQYLDLPGEKWEGLVWHHPDGRMCKIRRRDFGLKWPI